MLEALYGISYDPWSCDVGGSSARCMAVAVRCGQSPGYAARLQQPSRHVFFGRGNVVQLVPEAIRGQVNHRKQLRWRWRRSFPGRLELAGLELV